MNRKQLIFLSIAAAIVTVLALVIGNVQSGRHEAPTQSQLYPTLETQLNTITHVSVQRAGEPPVNIIRENDRWTVVEKAGYPADVGRLRQALISLTNAKLVEAKTRNPENYTRLGVQDVDKAEADTQRIDLLDKEGMPVAQVLIGKTSKGGGSYARKVDEEQSWLLSEQITLPANAEDWLNKKLIQLNIERIRRVDVRPVEGSVFAVIKPGPEQKDFQLENAPEGKQTKAGQPRRVASALSDVTLDDVLPDNDAPQSDKAWHTTVFITFDGLHVEAKVREVDDKHYLKLLARLDPQPAKIDPSEHAEGVKDEAEKTAAAGGELKTRQEVVKDVERLQERFEGWTFIIPSYKANTLSLTYEEMFEDTGES